MKFKYVNPKAVERYIGRYSPIGSFALAMIIEEALSNANQGYVHTQAGRRFMGVPEVANALTGIADRLLADNLNRAGRLPWDMYERLDFDFVHHVHKDATPAVYTEIKAYFHHTEHSRPLGQRRIVFHIDHHEIQGTSWSISFPLQIVLKGFPSLPDGYMGYAHGIHFKDAGTQHYYLGVTGRNWLERMAEHFASIRAGSNNKFHAAWRHYVGNQNVGLTSELVIVNHTYEQIMAWEEEQVDQLMESGTALNMIPGGFKGMRFLHEHRLLPSARVSVEERDAGIATYQAINPRAGVPNLIISDLWNDDRYAESVICGRDGRLSVDQVRKIRELNASGIPIEKIIELSGAMNLLQVERLLSQKTYTRIH